jgi:hypothetical protein
LITPSETVRVIPIHDKLRENKLRWFGHIYCRPLDVIDLIVMDSRVRGRAKEKNLN